MHRDGRPLTTFRIADTARSLHRVLVLIGNSSIRRLSYPHRHVLPIVIVANHIRRSCAVARRAVAQAWLAKRVWVRKIVEEFATESARIVLR